MFSLRNLIWKMSTWEYPSHWIPTFAHKGPRRHECRQHWTSESKRRRGLEHRSCFLLRINRLRVLSGGIGKRSLLSEESPELLALSLKEKKRLKSGTNTSFYRRRHAYFVPFFHEEGNLVLSHVSSLWAMLGLEDYNPDNWQLFIDSSKRSFKCDLLNYINRFYFISP